MEADGGENHEIAEWGGDDFHGLGVCCIKPVTLGGFRDYLPGEAAVRQEIVRVFRETCELFGFVPLETPAVERWDILSKDQENLDVIIYNVQGSREEGSDGTKKGLRFDLTVPLSRVVAANPNLPRLFKRYQAGPVWRGEKPQAGRYREFMQCDADIVGTRSPAADAELVCLMGRVFERLGIRAYRVKINNRKILNGLPALAGFAGEHVPAVLRILDKLEKEGLPRVTKALAELPFLTSNAVERIVALLGVAPGREEWLAALRDLFSGIDVAREGIEELAEMGRLLTSLGLPGENWTFDVSIVRGLGYYTGPVFETTLLACPEMGSVCSGGRYDNLTGIFGLNKPATGISLGLDRLYAALDRIKALPAGNAGPAAVVVAVDRGSLPEAARLAASLRDGGVRTTLYPESKVRDGLAYASAVAARWALVMGESEVAENTVQVKTLATGEQKTVSRGAVLELVGG